MIAFGTDEIDPEQKVVNPEYRRIDHRLKKVREKKQRLEAKFYPPAEKVMEEDLDQVPATSQKQAEYKEQLDEYKRQESELIAMRKECPPGITLREMPEQVRYNKLKTESKLLMNVIKMICYRAETAVANLCEPHLSRGGEEKRMFVKQLINNHADLIPDEQNKTLTIKLHSLSAPRFNRAAHELAILLNKTETVFPGSDLVMIFDTTALSVYEG